MIVEREKLVARLDEASLGLSPSGLLEQSDCFVFLGDKLVTFNDEVFVEMKNPIPGLETVVPADELLKLLAKIPDTEVEVSLVKDELQIKGKRRRAGITCQAEVHLPYKAVPNGGKWVKVSQDLNHRLQQAARTCGRDETLFLTTCVHVTKSIVEACDNSRLFRAKGKTGFRADVLLPAATLSQLDGYKIIGVRSEKGWAHFRLASRARVSLRCFSEKYMDGIDEILNMKDPVKVRLPNNLTEIIERAEVMIEKAYNARIVVKLEDGKLSVTAKKDAGWYRETRKVKWHGRPIQFAINPKFLSEMLARTSTVQVTRGKMKIETETEQFVVVLYTGTEDN